MLGFWISVDDQKPGFFLKTWFLGGAVSCLLCHILNTIVV